MAISCKRVVPILRMFDEAVTKQFYAEFLEFEVVFEHRFHDGAPLYMGLRKGDVELHVSGHFGDGTPGTHVRVETIDLDDYARLLRAKKYKHANPGAPTDQEWGCRELTIGDPSGNKLTFYMDLPRSSP
jgi:uncharacterized glyoxalase superfamily protein PhnB